MTKRKHSSLEENSPTFDAQCILDVCSFLSPSGIPVQFFLQNSATLTLGDFSQETIQEGIDELVDTCIIKRKYNHEASLDDPTYEILIIDEAVQDLTFDALTDEKKRSLGCAIVTALSNATRGDYFKSRAAGDIYILNIQHFLERFKWRQLNDLRQIVLDDLLTKASEYLFQVGAFDTGAEFAWIGMTISAKLYGRNHLKTATKRCFCALFHESLGNCRRANILRRSAQKIYRKSLGPDDINETKTFSTLVLIYLQQGRYDEVTRLYRSEKVRRMPVKPDEPDTTTQQIPIRSRKRRRIAIKFGNLDTDSILNGDVYT